MASNYKKKRSLKRWLEKAYLAWADILNGKFKSQQVENGKVVKSESNFLRLERTTFPRWAETIENRIKRNL